MNHPEVSVPAKACIRGLWAQRLHLCPYMDTSVDNSVDLQNHLWEGWGLVQFMLLLKN